MPENYTGVTSGTGDHLILDAGAFYKNYDVATGSGTLLGATQGGGEFVAKPEIRNIQADGIKGRAKGLNVVDSWEVSIKATFIEATPALLQAALGAADIDTTDPIYDKVTGRFKVLAADYISNITWIGRLSGSNLPVVIQIFNAMNADGLTLQTQDKNEGKIAITFLGHVDFLTPDVAPYAIYYPKSAGDAVAPTVTVVPADAATGVAVAANIVATFSEAVDPKTVNLGNFILVKASDGTVLPGSLTLNAAKTVATFDPTSNLTAATDYIFTITTNVKDANGNPLAAVSVTNFTTT